MKAAVALQPSKRALTGFLDNDHATPEKIRAIQDHRTMAQVRFAMEHTRFYRERYHDAGFRASDLFDPAAFLELPTVSKEDIRAHFRDFVSDEASRQNTTTNVTGGSTGEPLRVLRDLRVPSRALEWRLFDWWGIDPSVDVALVQRHTKSRAQAFKHNLSWWPSTRFQLDAFHMDARSIDAFISRWMSVRPGLLIGYAGAITELAMAVNELGVSLPPPSAVAVTAAPVTTPQRRAIAEAFGAPVYDHYRSSEIPWIAGECSAHDGLHVFADVRRVDIVTPDGVPASPGVIGDVLASDLTNRAFPIIRYRLGDRSASLGELCPCGRTLPRIAPILGRDVDALRLPSGQVVAGEGLAQIFSKSPDAVRQFQIHQLADYSVILKCVPTAQPNAGPTIDAVRRDLQSMLGNEIDVRCERVQGISHLGGKVRCVVSDVR